MNGKPHPVAAIEVTHLSHSYGRLRVLHDISFRVEAGEIYGFIGPNGAGKTTTIRTMTTLLAPTQGQVKICGVDVSREPERVRRLIGYMPDHAGVYPRVTLREYLEFFSNAYGITDPTVSEAVLELTDLGGIAERFVESLSKGMQQRLQLARVLLHDPQVLILDEPASDLDPRARIEIRDLLLELKELGKTILLSSHILSELSDICTSVGIVEKGRLLVSGPITQIAQLLSGRGLLSSHALKNDVGGERSVADADSGEPRAVVQSPAGTQLTPGGATVPAAVQHGLKLRILGDTFRLEPLLSSYPPITHVEPLGGGQFKLRYVGNDEFVAELVKYLVNHGILLVSVEPERNELERIFLEVTRGDLR